MTTLIPLIDNRLKVQRILGINEFFKFNIIVENQKAC